MAHIDDACVRTQEFSHLVDRLHGSGKANALWLSTMFFGERIQTGQRQREMRAAFIVRHCVDLVHDHGACGAEHCPRFFSSQQYVERLRRSDQNVRAMLAHLGTFSGRCIAGANRRTNFGKWNALALGQCRDFRQRDFEILVDVVA